MPTNTALPSPRPTGRAERRATMRQGHPSCCQATPLDLNSPPGALIRQATPTAGKTVPSHPRAIDASSSTRTPDKPTRRQCSPGTTSHQPSAHPNTSRDTLSPQSSQAPKPPSAHRLVAPPSPPTEACAAPLGDPFPGPPPRSAAGACAAAVVQLTRGRLDWNTIRRGSLVLMGNSRAAGAARP
jgi:hypothetical protein